MPGRLWVILAVVAIGTVGVLSTASVDTRQKKVADASDVQVPDFMVQAANEYLQRSTFFENATTNEEFRATLSEILSWTPPEFLQRNYPYYLSGRGYDGNPVWVIEGGKFDVKAITDQGPEMTRTAEKAFLQGFLRALKSTGVSGSDSRLNVQAVLDFEDMTFAKLGSPEAMSFVFEIASRYVPLVNYMLKDAVLINVNYVVETVMTAMRPILGNLVEKLETHGTNRAKWIPFMKKKFPAEVMPEWYGGSKDFQPVAVYG